VLAAILFPVFARAREQARAASCTANLANIGLALKLYADDHDGALPPRDDDLGPLHPRYLAVEQCFMCPSSTTMIPMGSPAHSPPKPKAEADGGPRGGPKMGGPGAGGMGAPGGKWTVPPGMQPGPPGGPPGPGGAPGSGPSPAPSSGPGRSPAQPQVTFAQSGPPSGGYGDDVLMTGYFYHAGRDLAAAPSQWMCSDHSPAHNNGANVLFTDGAIKRIPANAWAGMGLKPAETLMSKWGWPSAPDNMGGPPGGGGMAPPGGAPARSPGGGG